MDSEWRLLLLNLPHVEILAIQELLTQGCDRVDEIAEYTA